MTDFPEIGYGTVRGRFLAGVLDDNDLVVSPAPPGFEPEAAPDAESLSGYVTFSATAPVVRVVGAAPVPATLFPQSLRVYLDDEGYLSRDGSRDITLWATDDPDGNPVNWQWRVTFSLDHKGHGVYHTPFNFELPAGEVVDLTVVAPLITPSPGTIIIQGPEGPAGPGVTDLITAKGDMVAGTGFQTADIVHVGADGEYLTPDPVAPTGLAWKPLPEAPPEPPATETIKGIARYATQAEVDAGADLDSTVRPGTLAPYVAAKIGEIPPPEPGVKAYATLAEAEAVRTAEVGTLHLTNLQAAFFAFAAAGSGVESIFATNGPADLLITTAVSDTVGQVPGWSNVTQWFTLSDPSGLRTVTAFRSFYSGIGAPDDGDWYIVPALPPSSPAGRLPISTGSGWGTEAATSAPTGNAVIRRDPYGNAQIADPLVPLDIVNKQSLDAAVGAIPPPTLPARLGAVSQTINDWNIALSNGWYVGSFNSANAPTNGAYVGTVTVLDPTWIMQEVFNLQVEVSHPTPYVRFMLSGIWTPWRVGHATEARKMYHVDGGSAYTIDPSAETLDNRLVVMAGGTLTITPKRQVYVRDALWVYNNGPGVTKVSAPQGINNPDIPQGAFARIDYSLGSTGPTVENNKTWVTIMGNPTAYVPGMEVYSNPTFGAAEGGTVPWMNRNAQTITLADLSPLNVMPAPIHLHIIANQTATLVSTVPIHGPSVIVGGPAPRMVDIQWYKGAWYVTDPPAAGTVPPHTHPEIGGTHRFLYSTTPNDATAGALTVTNAGGNARSLTVSVTDADGGEVNLAPMTVGDSVVLSGTGAVPQIYARGYATAAPVAAGGVWYFDVVREGGQGALPAVGTPLLLTVTMANGAGGSVPDAATEVTAGIARYATQAEVDAGTDAATTVRPSTLAPYVAAQIAAIPPSGGGGAADGAYFTRLPASGGKWIATDTPRGGGYGYKTLTIGQAFFIPLLIGQPNFRIDALATSIETGVAGGLIRLGIYAAGADGAAGALVVDAGTAATDTNGEKIVTFAAVALPPGMYWVMEVATAAVNVRRTGGGSYWTTMLKGHNNGSAFDFNGVGTWYSSNGWNAASPLPAVALASIVGSGSADIPDMVVRRVA